jgi:catechol 2,3-dioxygenase-like lactoylglutathione lyase family enzyme
MPRGLDHIVHAVGDLDVAAAFYQRLGFTVGARNRHPWGTHNRLVQFQGFFIELVTVAEPDLVSGEGFGRLFAGVIRDRLVAGEGLALVMLESKDAEQDAADFRAAGIAASDVLRFEREGRRPDGSAVVVAFSLAFARDAAAPTVGFAVCQQHYPENFWNPVFQSHANAAAGIEGIVMIADNPADHHVFLSAFTGERSLAATSSGIGVATPRGDIAMMTPAAFTQHYGISDPDPDPGHGARLAAIRIGVRDMATTVKLLQAAEVPAIMRMGRVIIGPQAAMGATLIFEPI